MLRKTDVLKTCPKTKFLGKKVWRNALTLKSKRLQGIFGETFVLPLLSSAVFCLQNLISDFFNLFGSGVKGFYQSLLGNKVDFGGIMNVSPNIVIPAGHWKTLVPFCMRKKRPENAFLTLIVNYRKIIQKNKLRHPKQQ